MTEQGKIAESVTIERSKGVHPNSLANLAGHSWPKGVSGNPGKPHVGPMLAPAIRRYTDYSYEQLQALDLAKLPAIDVVAVTTILKACDAKYGDRTRELLAERLDGNDLKAAINVAVTKFSLTLNAADTDSLPAGDIIEGEVTEADSTTDSSKWA